jgi:phage head maturation protease
LSDPEVLSHVEFDAPVEVRSLSKREIEVRLIPWGVLAETQGGFESFERGAFADAKPSDVLLHGLEHEAHIGLGQNGQPVMTRHPVGRAFALDDKPDGQYAHFRVAKTARGDEVLALAEDGIASGVSVEFSQVPGGTEVRQLRVRRHVVHTRARLSGASTTYRPSYAGAEVIAVRSKETPVADAPSTEAQAAPSVDLAALSLAVGTAVGSQISGIKDSLDATIEKALQTRSAIPDDAMKALIDRLDAVEEQARANFSIPSGDDKGHPEDFTRGDWLKLVLRQLSGDTVSHAEVQARIAADLITTDNLGVVPTTFSREIVGIVDQGRPFLESTRRIESPDGMALTVPKIVTRPTTGVQSTEKTELTSTATSITTSQYNPVTVGGYGDISLQLLKKSSPSYLTMYLDLLGEAYAIDADDQAVDALISAGMSQGGSFDPDDGPKFGEAFANSVAVSRLLRPDTIWLSTAAVQQFIDAVNPAANGPLYSNLRADLTAAGIGGTISGLRPVHVPALDDETADIIVGPSRAFAWAEDGTYTLQVDVPAKAGRDVGLVGMLWFAPLYPTAFTRYWLES